jgi:hypothetical protein
MMKLKLQIAKWIVRRHEIRSRPARRALRDYQRQEWSRIKHNERCARGLRLYIAWTQRARTVRCFREQAVPAAASEHLVEVASPLYIIVPQRAH